MKDRIHAFWVVEFVSPPDSLVTYQLPVPVPQSELTERLRDTLLRFPADRLDPPLLEGQEAKDGHRWILYYAPDESSARRVADDIALTVGDFRLPWREGAFEDLVLMFHRLIAEEKGRDE